MAASLESINLYQELDPDSIDMINRAIQEKEEIEILTEKVKKANRRFSSRPFGRVKK